MQPIWRNYTLNIWLNYFEAVHKTRFHFFKSDENKGRERNGTMCDRDEEEGVKKSLVKNLRISLTIVLISSEVDRAPIVNVSFKARCKNGFILRKSEIEVMYCGSVCRS